MIPRKALPPQNPPDTLDLESGESGLEMAIASDITPSKDVSSSVVEQAKPPVPQKKTHVDEVFHLMKELERAREEEREAVEMMEGMAKGICEAEEIAEQKDRELGRVRVELRECEEELKNWKDRVQKLSLEIQEERRLAAEAKQSSDTQPTVMVSKSEQRSERERELTQLRAQVADLSASLSAQEVERAAHTSQIEKVNAKLRDENFILTSSLAEEEAKSKAAASRSGKEIQTLQKQIQQLKTDISQKDDEWTEKVRLAIKQTKDKVQAAQDDKQLQIDNTLKANEERLTAQLAQEQKLRSATEKALNETIAKLEKDWNLEQQLRQTAETSLTNLKAEHERTAHDTKEQASAQLADLQKRLHESETALQTSTSRLTHEQGLRQTTEATLQRAREQYDFQAQQASTQTSMQIADLQKRVQTAEAAAAEHASRMDLELDHENLRQQLSARAAEVDDQRRRCNFFKNNSERLTRQVKEGQGEVRSWEQKWQTAVRQLDETRGQLGALQQRVNAQNMPGGF